MRTYKERFEVRENRHPEDPSKRYSVVHLTPAGGRTYLAYSGIKHFPTKEQAEAYCKDRNKHAPRKTKGK